MTETPSPAEAEAQIKAVIQSYNDAVRDNNADGFRKAFHATAPIVQYQERDGGLDIKNLNDFITQIDGLHAKFGSAVEISDGFTLDIAGNIASARVPFRFQMGDKEFAGVNIFTLAVVDGAWQIMSKVYAL